MVEIKCLICGKITDRQYGNTYPLFCDLHFVGALSTNYNTAATELIKLIEKIPTEVFEEICRLARNRYLACRKMYCTDSFQGTIVIKEYCYEYLNFVKRSRENGFNISLDMPIRAEEMSVPLRSYTAYQSPTVKDDGTPNAPKKYKKKIVIGENRMKQYNHSPGRKKKEVK